MRAYQENATARVQPRRFDVCHRKGIWENADALIGDTAYGVPRGSGIPIAVVPRPPQRARMAMGLLAAIRDSHCGLAFLRASFQRQEEHT